MGTEISVIIPAYNAQRYIEKCLSSVRNQTFADFEVIIVIDGATDGTKAIAEAFAEKDGRFTVIAQENSGPSAARNAGIDLAKGRFITFADSDDDMEPNHLQALYDAIGDTQLAICGVCTRRSDGTVMHKPDYRTETLKPADILNRLILSENAFGGYVVNKLYRLSVINEERIRFLTGQKYMFEDILFNYQYLKHADCGVCCGDVTYNYVLHASEGMSRGLTDLRSKWLHYTDTLDVILAENDPRYPEFLYKVRMEKVWHCATAVRVLARYNEKKQPAYEKMRRYIGKNLIPYLLCGYLPVKKRLGGVLTYFFPKLSFHLWNKGR